jgi:hypothetical protein
MARMKRMWRVAARRVRSFLATILLVSSSGINHPLPLVAGVHGGHGEEGGIGDWGIGAFSICSVFSSD